MHDCIIVLFVVVYVGNAHTAFWSVRRGKHNLHYRNSRTSRLSAIPDQLGRSVAYQPVWSAIAPCCKVGGLIARYASQKLPGGLAVCGHAGLLIDLIFEVDWRPDKLTAFQSPRGSTLVCFWHA
ncbi:uncharacterized protein BO97DRAFT_97157 [Aspergillus homomorphus CBS 101889]|uniref:Uncharacterized protein n=1 Tax=Aspergillus homomorphus (strain CBS 101889) TaxID=1450537 RepID=A0A395HUC3_ASPHC|nr:hypothetical protein BO97DRAFT_97157 [Aspergillus homomorphus CBS 101889]RAL11521.1 hypothetical protein BO97DRAFT_97157 [Aspergillus homomorphus CBS 101889]